MSAREDRRCPKSKSISAPVKTIAMEVVLSRPEVPTSLVVGASLTGVTVRLALMRLLLKAVVPPLVLTSTLVSPFVPVLKSQALNVISPLLPK